jgi:uncharacterized membrane protein YgcG
VSTCPGCGAEVSFAVQETRVLTGTCAGCQRVTTLIEGPLPLGTAVPGAGEETPSEGAVAGEGPECAECGSPLTVAAREDGMLEVSCAECETVTTFVPEGSSPPRAPRDREERSPSRGDRPRRREESSSSGDAGFSNARPCRQCGAPLKFTTDAEGVLTGECSSCGNRFTLPPRRDSGSGRGDRGGYSSRGPPRYGRKPGGWSGGGGSGGGSSGGRPSRYGGSSGGYARRERSSDGDDSGDDRRRRRPRRE